MSFIVTESGSSYVTMTSSSRTLGSSTWKLFRDAEGRRCSAIGDRTFDDVPASVKMKIIAAVEGRRILFA